MPEELGLSAIQFFPYILLMIAISPCLLVFKYDETLLIQIKQFWYDGLSLVKKMKDGISNKLLYILFLILLPCFAVYVIIYILYRIIYHTASYYSQKESLFPAIYKYALFPYFITFFIYNRFTLVPHSISLSIIASYFQKMHNVIDLICSSLIDTHSIVSILIIVSLTILTKHGLHKGTTAEKIYFALLSLVIKAIFIGLLFMFGLLLFFTIIDDIKDMVSLTVIPIYYALTLMLSNILWRIGISPFVKNHEHIFHASSTTHLVLSAKRKRHYLKRLHYK